MIKRVILNNGLLNIGWRAFIVLAGIVVFIGNVLASTVNAATPALKSDSSMMDGAVIRAQLIAKKQTVISAGITGKLEIVTGRAGDTVNAGNTLILFDCRSISAANDMAAAKVAGAKARYDSSVKLLQFNSVGPLEVDVLKAELDMAQAELKANQAELRHCDIKAPYKSLITKRYVHPHQFVNRGEPLLELYSPEELELHLVVPSHWLEWISLGAPFQFKVDETQQQFQGTVSRIGGAVDPVSQTVELFGTLNSNKPNNSQSIVLLPGMSGTAQFQRNQQ